MQTETISSVRAFRDACGAFPTGVTVLSTVDGSGRVHGMTANAFVTISLAPKLVLVAIKVDAHMASLLAPGSPLSISILSEPQAAISNHFAGMSKGTDVQDVYRWDGFEVPVVDECSAWLRCRVQQVLEGGDHYMYLCEVTDHDSTGNAPLVFHGGRYGTVADKGMYDVLHGSPLFGWA